MKRYLRRRVRVPQPTKSSTRNGYRATATLLIHIAGTGSRSLHQRGQMQRTTKSIHKVSRLLLGGDARSVSAAPASAGLRQPSENEAVLKAFNHEVLVVKSRRETRGWKAFNVRRATHSPVCRSRHQLPSVAASTFVLPLTDIRSSNRNRVL